MITVFNGRSRGVGQQSREDIYIQVQVRLRSHLHLFKNARLAVFLAIALHSDKEGWSDPSIELLRSETGYNKDTIARALTDLCDLTLDGQRVLLAAQQRQRGGVFAKNRYLVFPSPDECAKYETSGELRKPRIASYEPLSPAQPSSENQYTVVAQPSSENQYTAEIEVQPAPMPQNGDSPSIGFPSPVFPYGSITILKNHGDDGDRARAKKNGTPQEPPPHVAYLASQGMGAATDFAQLDPDTCTADFNARRADNIPVGTIVNQWRLKPPTPEDNYARQRSLQPPPAPNRPRRSAVVTHDADRDRRALAELERQTAERLARQRGAD